jgi:hypothetical protein
MVETKQDVIFKTDVAIFFEHYSDDKKLEIIQQISIGGSFLFKDIIVAGTATYERE